MPLAGRFTLEMIGTYFLVLVVSCAAVGMMAGDLAPLAIGGILAAMIFMAGPHCGAHFNPAVSVALMVRGAFPASEVVPYIVGQLIGAVLAALTQMVIIESSNGSETTAIVVAAFGENGGSIPDLAQIALAELVFTFALVLVILHVATTKEQQGNQYFGLAIGVDGHGGCLRCRPDFRRGFQSSSPRGPLHSWCPPCGSQRGHSPHDVRWRPACSASL